MYQKRDKVDTVSMQCCWKIGLFSGTVTFRHNAVQWHSTFWYSLAHSCSKIGLFSGTVPFGHSSVAWCCWKTGLFSGTVTPGHSAVQWHNAVRKKLSDTVSFGHSAVAQCCPVAQWHSNSVLFINIVLFQKSWAAQCHLTQGCSVGQSIWHIFTLFLTRYIMLSQQVAEVRDLSLFPFYT